MTGTPDRVAPLLRVELANMEQTGVASHYRAPSPLLTPRLWVPGYEKAASDAKLTEAPTLDAAVAAIGTFVDPLLNGTAAGRWEPGRRAWAFA